MIVSREEPDRYTNLARLFAGEPVDVVLDRRVGERRAHDLSALCERRRGDRRIRVRDEVRVPIGRDADVISVRQKGREFTAAAELSSTDSTVIATAVSELARNIVSYAKLGEIVLRVIENRHGPGVEVVAADGGPGIMNIVRALGAPESTRGEVGGGLAGVRGLVDIFFVTCEPFNGTAITIRRWRR